MSLWDRLRGKEKKPPDVAAAKAPSSPPPSTEKRDLDRLDLVGTPDGPDLDEAVALFRHLRQTPEEGHAIDSILARAATAALPEPLLVAVASALVDRGEPRAALKALGEATSSGALLLAADLHADVGDHARALALVERILLRDLDHPGARDRHRRWRDTLGFGEQTKRADPTAATVVASEPDSPFRLLREVARGGAGAVYEAEDRELLRKVALKIYHHPERDRTQLTLEAKVAVALSGPHVVRVLDVDPEHGWLALEWAQLGALRDHVRAKNAAALLPIERWALPLATALARVHAAGWVHNDVKPANVLLRAPSAPLLSDFGIARRAGEPSPPGSLGYVSPERMAGRASHPKDDVYGFGRILEDVLDAIGDGGARWGWRAFATTCTGADADRPADARAVVTRLRVEAG